MSMSVTSPISASARYRAAEAPTFPAPTTLSLGTRRLIRGPARGFACGPGLGLGIDGDLHPPLAAPREHNEPVLQGEDRVVLAASHVQARRDRGPPLTNDDAPGADPLPAEPLHTEPLRRRI